MVCFRDLTARGQHCTRHTETRNRMSIGIRAPSDLGGGDIFARKNYTMPECVILEKRTLFQKRQVPCQIAAHVSSKI